MTFPLRVGRSRSIWEDGTDDEILRKEFPSKDGGVDLRPSVYRVEPDDAVRATAEHVLQRLGPPVAVGVLELNLECLAPLLSVRASGCFEFTNECHAELLVENQRYLRELIATIRRNRDRRIQRDRDAIMRYVAERLQVADEEWVGFMESHPRWHDAVARWSSKESLAPRQSTMPTRKS